MRLRVLTGVCFFLALISVTTHAYRRRQIRRGPPPIQSIGEVRSPLADSIEQKEAWLVRHPDDVSTRLELARLQFINRDFRRCIYHLHLLESEQPQNLQVLVRLAMALREDQRLEEALTVVTKAAKLAPKNERVRECQADLLLTVGRSSEATEAFDACLRLNPRSYAALLGKARAMEQLHLAHQPMSVESFTSLMERAVKLEPRNPEGLSTLARMLFSYAGQFARAEELANEVVRLTPDNPYPYLILTEINLAQPTPERLEQAGRYARKAAALDPNNPEPLYLLGRAQWRQNKPAEAVASLEQSMRIRSMPQAVYLLSLAYRRVGQDRRADEHRAIYQRWNDFMEKRKKLMGELQHRPQDVEVYYRFADLYLSTGDLEPAENWTRKARNLAGNTPRVQQLLAKLEEQKRSPPAENSRNALAPALPR